MGIIRDIQKLSRIQDRPKDLQALEEKDKADLQSYANEFSPPNNETSSARVKMTTTEGQLYFIALTTLDRLNIQFVPDQLEIARNPSIANIQVVGRNNPIYHYISGDTTMRLELDFHAMTENRQDVIDKCKWLEHLAYNDGYEKEPQKVKLVFGELFQDEQWIVRQVSYSLSNFNKQKGFLPQQAYVSVELGLDPESNLLWEDIRRDNDNRHLGT